MIEHETGKVDPTVMALAKKLAVGESITLDRTARGLGIHIVSDIDGWKTERTLTVSHEGLDHFFKEDEL